MSKKKKTIQRHHIQYATERTHEWVVPIYRGEHRIITLTQWMKYPSKGFIQAMRYELERLERVAVDLPLPTEEEVQQRKVERRRLRNAKRRSKKEKAKRSKVSRNKRG